MTGLIKAEQLGAEHRCQRQADGQDRCGRGFAKLQLDRLVADVHPEVAQAGCEVVQISPDQGQGDQLPEETRQAEHADVEGAGEARERDFRGDRGVEHPDDEGHQSKHHGTAGAVQDGDPTGCGQSVTREIGEGVDVAELRPLFG